MEFIYPAKFDKDEDGGYAVSFPDIRGAYTCGKDLKEALDYAEDCLGGLIIGYEEDKLQLPTPSMLSDFSANTEDSFITLIKVNLTEYKKRINDKPVRKTVYIPRGLNDEAEEKGINFSQVLRNALTLELRP